MTNFLSLAKQINTGELKQELLNSLKYNLATENITLDLSENPITFDFSKFSVTFQSDLTITHNETKIAREYYLNPITLDIMSTINYKNLNNYNSYELFTDLEDTIFESIAKEVSEIIQLDNEIRQDLETLELVEVSENKPLADLENVKNKLKDKIEEYLEFIIEFDNHEPITYKEDGLSVELYTNIVIQKDSVIEYFFDELEGEEDCLEFMLTSEIILSNLDDDVKEDNIDSKLANALYESTKSDLFKALCLYGNIVDIMNEE